MSNLLDLPSKNTNKKLDVIFQLPSQSSSLFDTPLQLNEESSQLKYEYIFTKKHEYCYIDKHYSEYLQLNNAENVTFRKKDDKIVLNKNHYEKINYDEISSLPLLPERAPSAVSSFSPNLIISKKLKQKQFLMYTISILIGIVIVLLLFISFLGGIYFGVTNKPNKTLVIKKTDIPILKIRNNLTMQNKNVNNKTKIFSSVWWDRKFDNSPKILNKTEKLSNNTQFCNELKIENNNLSSFCRQKTILEMMRTAFSAYKTYAWGSQELKPVSNKPVLNNYFTNSELANYKTLPGLSIVDAMSTLWIMGLTEEWNEGKKWINNHLNVKNLLQEKSLKFSISTSKLLFDYTGGLLSAYALSGEELMLQKAIEVIEILKLAVNKSTGMLPCLFYNSLVNSTIDYVIENAKTKFSFFQAQKIAAKSNLSLSREMINF